MTLISRLTAAFAVVLAVLAIFAPLPAEGQGSVESDRVALVALYDATGGANWNNNTNWKTDRPLSEWHGVTTAAGGRVIRLDLWQNNVSGEIPSRLGDLTSLRYLSLRRNNLSGEIPRELGGLANLDTLDLLSNNLNGEIPRELGGLTNLLSLYLAGNNLAGEIPRELGSLTNLVELSMSNAFRENNLSGEIPRELGSLVNLQILSLQFNDLSGEIPRELGSLTNLRYLTLRGNDLSGEIPRELGSLTNLVSLDLPSNDLSGEIPRELGSLMNLEGLTLRGNNLTGEIPRELARFEDTINPQQNGVILPIEGEGTVDPVDSAADRAVLEMLYDATGGANWDNNEGWKTDRPLSEWYGVTTRIAAGVATVAGLSLPDNNLTGEIPPRLADLPNLETLVLNGNNLTGTIPDELRRFEGTINPQQGGVNLPVGTPVPALPFVGALLLACGLYVMGRRRLARPH